MSSSLETLSGAIQGFPGYANELDRRTADEMIRSYAGERVSEMEERLQPLDATLSDACASALMRTGFIDQDAFRDFEYAVLDDAAVERMCQADLATVEVADRAKDVDRDGLIAYLGEVNAALDRREGLMTSAGAGSRG
jgi:N-acetylglucosamine kinase-like BadF-type ATPase